jgi:acyl-coenzyme A thioesterase PaaI-like protein
MNILAIPFHRYLGLTLAEPPGLVQLAIEPHHLNHLGTVHASVMIAVAEAGSGLFLQQHAGEPEAAVMPIIRRIDAKFHQAGTDKIVARSMMDASELRPFMEQLKQKQRARITVPMQVVDVLGTPLLSISFEWFVQQKKS